MFYLNRLFSGRSLKTILLIACFIIIGVAIWYLGPYVGFGKTRPLEAVHTRVVFIVLAFLWLLIFFWRIPLFILIALTLCVFVWEIGPFILLGEGWPLKNTFNRFVIVAIIAFLTLIYAGWLLLLALSRNPHLLSDLQKFRKGKSKPLSETLEVTAVIRNAVSRTRKASLRIAKWRQFFVPVQDTLPWYMVIGNEQAGKTSLIVSSGQSFPLPEQLSRVTAENAPTPHCECWFANDALFVDTAGKYISDGGKEAKPEWDGILGAIGKYRPVKAINGVIVAISVVDIMESAKNERHDIVVALRRRLDEIRATLGVRFPVYVIITKMDRVTGFDEYFRNLTAEAREQIWGVTFPYGEKTSALAAEQHIEQELSLLVSRIDNTISQRQQEEHAIVDRRKIYALSQDFRAVASEVAEVVHNIFFASRYDETQFYSTLRGVYFASARQPAVATIVNKTTLVQRWRQALSAKLHGISGEQEQSEGSEVLLPSTNGRNYFLRQLFSEIIVKDAGLVRYNLHATRRNMLMSLAGHAACALLAFWLINGIVTSFGKNSGYLDVVEHRLDELESSAARFVKTKNESLLPYLLEVSQSLPQMENLDVNSPELSWRYGLYLGFRMVDKATGLYEALLHRLLLPQIEQQTALSLEEALGSDDPDRLYNALKLYLMIFGEGKFDREFVEDSLVDRWGSTEKIEPYRSNATFVAHLRRLFGPSDWRQYGRAADPELIRQARSQLSHQTPEERIYQQVRDVLNQDAPPNITLNSLTGEEGGTVFSLSDETLRIEGIPGLFTQDGYYGVVKKKAFALVARFGLENRWVMGQPTTAYQDLDLYGKVLSRYLRDYTMYWRTFLADVHLSVLSESSFDTSAGLSVDLWLLRTLASTPSPLTRFAKEVARQTTLSVQGETLSDELNIEPRSRTLSQLKKYDALLANQEKKWVRAGVDDHFVGLREFVFGGGATGGVTPLNRMMALLNEQYTMLVISKNAMSNGDALPVNEDGKKLLAEAQTWPDPFREMVEPLLMNVFDTVEVQQVTQNNNAISSSLGSVCRATLAGKYPFAEVEEEVSLSAFTRFFAAGGLVDDYFTKNLAAKVDTSSSPWRYKGMSGGEGLDVFEQAAEIRNAFFQEDGGRKLSLDLSLSVPHLSPLLMQLTIDIGGSKYKYAHGPVRPFYTKWPGSRPGIVLLAKPVTVEKKSGDEVMTSRLQIKGPWAIFRLPDSAVYIDKTATNSEVLTLNLDKRRVDLDISGLRYGNSSLRRLLQKFRCPTDR